MSETGFALVDNGIPNSSGISKNDWVDRKPEQLIRDGYVARRGFAPSQAQSTVATETQFEELSDDNAPISTATRPSNGLIVQLPVAPLMAPTATMHALQEWEGYVLESRGEEFSARLLDLTADAPASQHGRMPEEEAVIPLSELSDFDAERLRPGSVFRWVIGYERSAGGMKRRISQIVFRDLPAMTEKDRTEGLEWARRIAQTIAD